MIEINEYYRKNELAKLRTILESLSLSKGTNVGSNTDDHLGFDYNIPVIIVLVEIKLGIMLGKLHSLLTRNW